MRCYFPFVVRWFLVDNRLMQAWYTSGCSVDRM
jgi:hypothetical protein